MFPEHLKALREGKKLTQFDLAEALHVSPSTIGGYEQGRRTPDMYTLVDIADYFDTSIDWLVERMDKIKN